MMNTLNSKQFQKYNKSVPETKKKLIPIRNGSKKFKLILGKDIMNKINFLCMEIPNREWSGVLFYKINKGSIEDVENLELEAIDVYPLDIGTSTYTEFEYTTDYAGYIAQNPALMDAQTGLIHSHNNMSVFFSATDTNTLREQAPLYKRFLSVIVNNKLDIAAAISVEAKETKHTKIGLEFQDLDYTDKSLQEQDFTVKTENVALRFDAEIEASSVRWSDPEFTKIVNSLKKDDTKHSYKQNAIHNTQNVRNININNSMYKQSDLSFYPELPFNDFSKSNHFNDTNLNDLEFYDDVEEDREEIIINFIYSAASLDVWVSEHITKNNLSEKVSNVFKENSKYFPIQEYEEELKHHLKVLYDDIIFRLDREDLIDFQVFIEHEFNSLLVELEETLYIKVFDKLFNKMIIEKLSKYLDTIDDNIEIN